MRKIKGLVAVSHWGYTTVSIEKRDSLISSKKKEEEGNHSFE